MDNGGCDGRHSIFRKHVSTLSRRHYHGCFLPYTAHRSITRRRPVRLFRRLRRRWQQQGTHSRDNERLTYRYLRSTGHSVLHCLACGRSLFDASKNCGVYDTCCRSICENDCRADYNDDALCQNGRRIESKDRISQNERHCVTEPGGTRFIATCSIYIYYVCSYRLATACVHSVHRHVFPISHDMEQTEGIYR